MFKVALWLPIAFSIILGGYLGFKGGYGLDVSVSGLKFFYEDFKVLLWLAALSFPAVALVAADHRSRQTLTQIKAAQEQNTFSNYYKHREEFFKLLDSLEKNFVVEFSRRSQLYRRIFPGNSHLAFSPISPGGQLRSAATEFNDLVKAYAKGLSSDKDARRFIRGLIKVADNLNVYPAEETGVPFWTGSGGPTVNVMYSDEHPLAYERVVRELIVLISEFAGYLPGESLDNMQTPTDVTLKHVRNVFSADSEAAQKLFGDLLPE